MPSLESIISILIVGLIAGWLAGRLTRGKGFGVAGNLIVGVLGALLGGLVLNVLGFASRGLVASLISATGGSVLLLFLLRYVKRD